ncbi:GNAT family N-acetyltransferase [Ramlibacter sp.]|uniref:GNAT family N-acetyltransferase n=1 Tax=Ramlibacter sp. TaxID=1917967 RepID=UPI002CD45A29|nr:GNAT family N-acetyltransferase [Ramlibacter sp.]HWI80517.1 GNAT family N-acetyltransferase [Ramlibacter sp.]
MKNNPDDYVSKVVDSALEIDAGQWNSLLALQAQPTPFMRHEYLAALERSASATPAAGWTPRFVTLTRGGELQAACALYLKDHSYGEYVFDWAWANAYQQHGLAYYPKALVAVPFTPVPGSRLLARDAGARLALLQALLAWCRKRKLSSLHLLFGADEDVAACAEAGLMLRHTVQFHWTNEAPASSAAAATAGPRRYDGFDQFLASLAQEKRKKIRQEQRKVAEAGVTFRWSAGSGISAADWNFFYRCYERTYLEHGNAPYLTRDFFRRMAATMPRHWVLFIAERGGRPIASSLIAVTGAAAAAGPSSADGRPRVAYGRYWGALERVDCLHFDACYYQPLQWCIEHGLDRFEGGAQGEHKMARALMPVKTTSAHWLAHPAFADAVERFLAREGQGVEHYLAQLERRSPFKQSS